MTRSNLRADMIDWLVPYQANTRIVESTAERIGLPMDRVMMVIQKYGTTTAATIPFCLRGMRSGDSLEVNQHRGYTLCLTSHEQIP